MKKLINKIVFFIVLVVGLAFFYKTNIVDASERCEYNHQYQKNENIVFLGDSITEWFPLDIFFEGAPIVNSGLAGNTTIDVLNDLDDRVYKYNPTKVIILIGTNDLKDKSIKNEDIPNNIKKIIQAIKKNRKKTKIYVQSIYPINNGNNEKINKANVEPRTNEKIQEANEKIKEICNEEKVTYINVYDELIAGDKSLDLRYTRDGLHISDIGYYKVSKVLLPYLEQ